MDDEVLLRFGEQVDDEVLLRIEHASSSQLERWLERGAVAMTLTDALSD